MPEPPSPRPPPAANPGSPTARTPHQDRSVEVTRYLDGALDLEHTVRRTISVDMRFGVARSEHRLGPIGDACEGRDVGVELYATPPRLHDYASAVSKAVALAERPTAPCEGSALVVRCRRSIGVFRRMPLVPSAHRGWRWHGLGPAVLHVVDARQLSRDGTWGAVRMIADPPPRSPDEDLLAELRRDPKISIEAVVRVAEAIMNETIRPSTHAQYRTAAEIVREEGREQGRNQGLADGRKQGLLDGRRASVLTLADARGLALTPAQRRRVVECADIVTLDRWLVEAAAATSAGDIFR